MMMASLLTTMYRVRISHSQQCLWRDLPNEKKNNNNKTLKNLDQQLWVLKDALTLKRQTYISKIKNGFVIRHLANPEMRCICSQGKIMLHILVYKSLWSHTVSLSHSILTEVVRLPTKWFSTVSPFPSIRQGFPIFSHTYEYWEKAFKYFRIKKNTVGSVKNIQ